MEYFLEIDNDSMFCAQGYGKKILKITRMSQIEPMNHFVQSRYARNMRYVLNTFQGFSRQMLLLVLAVSVGFFSSAGSFHRQAEEGRWKFQFQSMCSDSRKIFGLLNHTSKEVPYRF